MGIARRTVKKWLDRYNAEGPAGLLDRSSRPHTGPTRTAPRTEQLIVATRRRERRGLTDIDTTQAITFYRTERGRSEHSTNRRLSRGDSPLLGYDAFHLVDRLMTQPLLWKLAPNPVDVMVIEGAGHYEIPTTCKPDLR